MSVIISPDSELGKELAKWNAPKREGGMNANGFEPYPRMVYKADRYSNGTVMCGHPRVAVGDDPEANAFTARCQKTVFSADEHEQCARLGWCDSPTDAIAAFEKAATAEADAAAAAQYQAKRMSEKSQREFDAAQDAAEFHDAEVKAPAKRSHHKKKADPVVTT